MASIATTAVAQAGGPTRGRILAPGDHFQPGEAIAVSGTGIDEGLELVLRLTNGSTVAELGTVVVGPDQTFSTSVTVPPTFPLGYAELTAVSQLDSEWRVVVLIGDRAEAPGGSNASPLLDEQALALAVLAIGIVVFVVAGVAFLRSRSRSRSA